jgi:glycosyltransferase involved in cell wall biosynthesis
MSIIIPSYNRAALIKETLQSVVAQSSPDWECIVVDDGSTDETIAVVSAFAKADSRIQLLERTKDYAPGGNGARQMGIGHTNYEWIMFLDSDDLLSPDCVKNRLASIEETLDMIIFHTGTFKKEIGDMNIVWNLFYPKETIDDYLHRFLQQDMPWCTPGVLWNKAFLQKIGGWNQTLTAWQDWELHIRALTYAPKIKASIEKPDNYYRRDVDNAIGTKKKTAAYTAAIKNAIVSIEPRVLSYTSSKSIRNALKFLIYRNLIANPIKWKSTKLSKKAINSGTPFKTVSKQQLMCAYWRERFYAITIVKRILKHKLKFSYYTRLHPQTTFLKKKF